VPLRRWHKKFGALPMRRVLTPRLSRCLDFLVLEFYVSLRGGLLRVPTSATSDALQQPPPLIGLRENITPIASIAIQLRKIRTVRTKVITPPPINRCIAIFLQFHKQSNGLFVTTYYYQWSDFCW
jgi:hypothetical protein